jgi:glycosyltransferase involved in cell wall biosynthesis
VTANKGFVCMIAYTNYAFDARVRREAETLASRGFRVRCLTTKNGGAPGRFVMDGVEVQELRVPKYRGKSTSAYIRSYVHFMVASSAACLRLLARGELDVVHIHNIPDFLVLAGLLPRLAGRKVVLDVHDSVPETFATKFSNGHFLMKLLCLEEKLSAFAAHRVICVNHPQREALVARGIPRSKTFISMNVPDPRIFTPASPGPAPVPQRDHFNLVYHGTMAERLGVDLIIRAVARLRDQIPALRLHLWGHGDDLGQFQDLARTLDLEQMVLFKPSGVPLAELPRQLACMDVGVVGNRRTVAGDLMLPVKLVECVSLGIPVVAPRLRTIEHYFTDQMVTYYEPGNVQSLADAIGQLHARPTVRSSQAANAREFLRQYGWEQQGAALVGLYQRLVGDTTA